MTLLQNLFTNYKEKSDYFSKTQQKLSLLMKKKCEKCVII